MDGPRLLVGGQLLLGLRAVGVTRPDITDVICTHLHADHCGWLFDNRAQPVFPQATIWFGAHDWHHFVLDPDIWMFDHIRHGFRAAAETGNRLHPINQDITIAPGVTATMTPGHTWTPQRHRLLAGTTRHPARRRHRLPCPTRRTHVALHR
jgi:glyoxylase-like metal-dependent hydrolase (beta-lactamase superfamily II)